MSLSPSPGETMLLEARELVDQSYARLNSLVGQPISSRLAGPVTAAAWALVHSAEAVAAVHAGRGLAHDMHMSRARDMLAEFDRLHGPGVA